MKTVFVEDRAYDGRMIWEMLRGEDPAGIEARWKDSGIAPDLLKKIRAGRRFKDVESVVKGIVDARYEKDGASVLESVSAYQAAWDPINDAFYGTTASITGQDWAFPEYKVVVGLFHRGISSRDSNVVVRIAGIDPPRRHNRITAHEILMTHLWRIFDARYPAAKKDPLSHFWAMNEITAVCLLGLEPALDDLWIEETRGFDRYLSNYPQLGALKAEAKDAYLAKKDFADYLSKMISRVESRYKKTDFGRK